MSRRRFQRKRRNGGQFLRTTGQIAKVALTALRIAQSVKAIVNAEWKHFDNDSTNTPNDTLGIVDVLTNMAQGDTSILRTGNSVLPKIISWKIDLVKHATPGTTRVRVMLVRDKQFDGASPLINQILDETQIDSFYNIDNSSRFRILFDRMFLLTTDKPQLFTKGSVSFNKPQRGTNMHRHDFHIKYDGVGSGVGDLKDGQLVMVFLSDQATNTPTVRMHSRLRYIDN